MLLPEDPKRRPELWDGLREQLAHERLCYVITEGVGNTNAEASIVDTRFADSLLRRMHLSKISRVSANHGKPISPHFAAEISDSLASITEFVTHPSDGALLVEPRRLRRELEIAVVAILFSDVETMSAYAPLNLQAWEMKDVRVEPRANGLIFTRN